MVFVTPLCSAAGDRQVLVRDARFQLRGQFLCVDDDEWRGHSRHTSIAPGYLVPSMLPARRARSLRCSLALASCYTFVLHLALWLPITALGAIT